MDPFTAAAVVGSIGKIIGGYGAKQAAKRAYEIAKRNIKQQTKWKKQDLSLGTQSLMGRIQAASQSQGRRRATGVEENEADKFTLRMNRINKQEQMAIEAASEKRRAGIKAGDTQMIMGAVTAPIDYQIAGIKSDYYKTNTGPNHPFMKVDI